MMNSEYTGFGRRRLWLASKHYPSVCLERLETMNILDRVTDDTSVIRNPLP
jgi:hypothetical protein